jgi:protoporphyrinogen oxidase
VADRKITGLELGTKDAYSCGAVVSTVPLDVLAGLLPQGWDGYAARLRRIRYIGVVCVSFKLARRVSNNFWLNVNDHRIPFNGIIEYTNLNPMQGRAGHIVYVPYYVPTDHPLYRMDDQELVQKSWEALKLLQPTLRDSDHLAHHLARAPYAQAVCPTGFLDLLPGPEAPIEGLHLLDSTFLYPEDRTQSGHVTKAWACAARMDEAAHGAG